jgi:nitrogen fixation protein FixH
MNWGYRIILVYLIFISGIVAMAVVSFQQPLELETENYYEAEKEQNDRMNQRVLGNAFRPLIKIEQDREQLRFLLPADITEKPELWGELRLIRPSDKSLDRTISFDALNNGVLAAEKRDLKFGFWKYALEWKNPFGHYLIEDTLRIN